MPSPNVGPTKERIQTRLVDYLFNPDTLAKPRVTLSEIARAAKITSNGKHTTATQVSRWLEAMHLDKTSRKKNIKPMEPEAVGQWLTAHLTFDQVMNLYEWAKENRPDQMPVPEDSARGYKPNTKRKHKKAHQTKAERQKAVDDAKAAVEAIVNGQSESKNMAESAKQVDDLQAGLNDKIHAWLADGSWSMTQAKALANDILNAASLSDVAPQDAMSKAVFDQMQADDDFNPYQWAFDTAVSALTQTAQKQLMQLINHEPVSGSLKKGTGQLFANLMKHQDQIAIKDGKGDAQNDEPKADAKSKTKAKSKGKPKPKSKTKTDEQSTDQTMTLTDTLAQLKADHYTNDELGELAWQVLSDWHTAGEAFRLLDHGERQNQAIDLMLKVKRPERFEWAFEFLYHTLDETGKDAFLKTINDEAVPNPQRNPSIDFGSNLALMVKPMQLNGVEKLTQN